MTPDTEAPRTETPRELRHRENDPPAAGTGWQIQRAIEPWYQLIKKAAVIALIWPAIKLALALEQLPKEVTALKVRVDALETIPPQLDQIKKATCFSIASYERRYNAGCPPEIERIIEQSQPPQSPR